MKDNFKKQLGIRLRLLRIEKGLAIKDVAREIGVGCSTISFYENAKHAICLDTVLKLLNYYQVDPTIFFNQISAKTHE